MYVYMVPGAKVKELILTEGVYLWFKVGVGADVFQDIKPCMMCRVGHNPQGTHCNC